MKRFLNIIFTLSALVIVAIPMLIIAVLIRFTSPGPVFHVSKRIGRNNVVFDMFKFRTMFIDTPQLATHLMKEPGKFVTQLGTFLRKTSLDEVPQLINVFKGDMSIIGPRPALFNQDDLVEALRQGKLAGAAADVFATEPLPPDSPLLTFSNFAMTPHMAYYSPEAELKLRHLAAQNIADFFNGTGASHIVNLSMSNDGGRRTANRRSLSFIRRLWSLVRRN